MKGDNFKMQLGYELLRQGNSDLFISSSHQSLTDRSPIKARASCRKAVKKLGDCFSFSKSLKSRIENQERTDRLVFAHFKIDGLDCDDRTSNRINKVLSKHTVNDSRKLLIPVYRRKKEKVGYCQN